MTRKITETSKLILVSLAVAYVLGAAKQAKGQDTPHEARNKALVRKSFDAWKAGTGSPFDLLAEHASWTITGNSAVSGTYPSREAFLSAVIRPFNARMTGHLTPVVRNIYADDDTVIVYFDAAGAARDGKPYRNSYTWLLDLQNGKVIRAVAFFDSVEFNALWSRVTPALASPEKQ